ncbi:serine hydrolase domain-containing protein [Dokdonia pacifica]|uniref:CubicO group peptidase, beta-lactamase class C family n=1 Tax=Dokdonia pacifica TaxID=1627892 RepID=A0A238WSN9_9FLAO|nr:serine hydrolase domain-containing protein [Dokdonia pacifica]SNR49343.1 CubicO group peptidase, beta-lactamase class C family [Dokdonia pacifica]
MKIRSCLYVLYATCILLTIEKLHGQSSQTQQLQTTIDAIVSKKMAQYDIPGLAIGIISQDTIMYTKGYGVRSIYTSDPVTENSVFHTASISKLFTAIAIIDLEHKGCLRLDDTLVEIAPELRSQDKNVSLITIRQLLNHTSGLGDISNYNWNTHNQSKNSLKNSLLKLSLKCKQKPSTTYSYSNLGYNILGYIIEKITNQSFEDYVQKEILNTIGMPHSDFRYYNIPDHLRTSPHSRSWFNKTYIRKNYPYTREHAPSSTLNASARDLSLWMISFLSDLKDPSNRRYQNMILPSFESYPYIGLGFQLYNVHSNKAIGHYGGDTGFRSFLMMIPEQNIGILLLANCDYNEDFRQEIVYEIASLMMY